MTDLRALVGAGFLPAVMGFVVSVPLVGALSSSPPKKSISSTPVQPLPSNSRPSVIGEAYTEKIIKGDLPAERRAGAGEDSAMRRIRGDQV